MTMETGVNMAEKYRILRRTKAVDGKKKPIVFFQVRFLDDTGKIIKTKTVPDAKTAAAAVRFAEEYIQQGILPASRDTFILKYCQEFWGSESPYFKTRRLRGKPLSESYRESGFYGLKHFESFLEGKKVSDLKADAMQAHADKLREKGINPRSINLGIEAVRRPVAVFCKKWGITNPLAEVERYQQTPKKRGILTPAEVQKIVEYEADPRARLIVLLGCLCGLRMGEARALTVDKLDLKNQTIRIDANVVKRSEGIKAPKYDSSRTIPAPDAVLDGIRLLQRAYPGKYAVPNYADLNRPVDASAFRRAFPRVLEAIGIDTAEQKRRNLVYHGLRHTYVSLMQDAGLAPFIVSRLVGHTSVAMTERYTNSEGLVQYKRIADVIAGSLEQAPKERAALPKPETGIAADDARCREIADKLGISPALVRIVKGKIIIDQ